MCRRFMLLLTLFFALAGTGLAASRYLVTSIQQIKPSVRAELRGRRGPAGMVGATGATGATGAAGITGVVVRSFVATIGQNTDTTVVEPCSQGAEAIGGGWAFDHPDANVFVYASEPNGDATQSTGWIVRVRSDLPYYDDDGQVGEMPPAPPMPPSIRVWAVCAPAN